MLQQPEPDDYVVATGETHSVRAFVERAFREIRIDIEWKGHATQEHGVDASNGRVLVAVDPRYFRPTEVEILVGDATKAREKLGWRHEIKFDDLVTEMVREDLKSIGRDLRSGRLKVEALDA